jgi:hypothetical protein
MKEISISSKLTFFTKYFLPFSWILVFLFFSFIIISNTLYPFMPLLIFFWFFFIKNIKFYMRIRKAFIVDRNIRLLDFNKSFEILRFEEIKEIKRYKLSYLKLVSKQDVVYYILLNNELLFSNTKTTELINLIQQNR